MNKSDIKILTNGNLVVLGTEYTEGFFKMIAKDIDEDKFIYLTEENGTKLFNVIDKERVTFNE